MKLKYVLSVTVDVTPEGGRPDREALGDDVGDALREEIEALTLDGSTAHATKDDEVEWSAEVVGVAFGTDD